MIEIVVVDDHPAVLAGLVAAIEGEPDLACRATTTSAREALEIVRVMGPSVVVADYQLPDMDGLTLCAEVKSLSSAPGVLLYSAFARPALVPAAAVAGADALLDKVAPADELFEAVRAVSNGDAQLPTPSPEVMKRCYAKLHPDDLPLFGMAVHGVAPDEIAAVVGASLDETRRRLRAVLGRLCERPVGPGAAGDLPASGVLDGEQL